MSPELPGQANWDVPGSNNMLLDDQVHIWRAVLDIPIEDSQILWRLLSADEQDRAVSYKNKEDRSRFIARRGILRTILASYLDYKPENIQFIYNPYGKPALAGNWSKAELGFNVSHSAGVGLFAFARKKNLGVDIERWDDGIDHLLISENYFSPIERRELLDLAPDARVQGFFQCWTRKEAFIKACGEGLSIPLDQFDVSFVPGRPVQLLATSSGLPSAHAWSIVDIQVGDHFSAALAVEKPVARLKLLDFNSGDGSVEKNR